MKCRNLKLSREFRQKRYKPSGKLLAAGDGSLREPPMERLTGLPGPEGPRAGPAATAWYPTMIMMAHWQRDGRTEGVGPVGVQRRRDLNRTRLGTRARWAPGLCPRTPPLWCRVALRSSY